MSRGVSSARSTGRWDRPKATHWALTRSSGRLKRRLRSAAASCCCRAATTRTCLSSGHEDLFRQVKTRFPDFRLHALSPPEVIHISRLAQIPTAQVIDRLIAAGLDSVLAAVPRFWSIASNCSIATARPRRTSGSASCARRIARGLRTTATDVRNGGDDGGAAGASVPSAELQDEDRRVHHVDWMPDHGTGRAEATVDYLRTLAIARLVLTTSTTCKPHGSRKAARWGS